MIIAPGGDGTVPTSEKPRRSEASHFLEVVTRTRNTPTTAPYVTDPIGANFETVAMPLPAGPRWTDMVGEWSMNPRISRPSAPTDPPGASSAFNTG